MRRFLTDILRDVRAGKNIDAYVTVLLCLVLAIWSLLGKLPLDVLGAALLTCLSWLILSALGARREKRDKPRASDFFSENYVHNSEGFRTSFQSTRDLCVVGMGQSRMISTFRAEIQRILAEGGRVRFVLTEPDGIATEMAIRRGSVRGLFDAFRQVHWAALKRLSSYSQDPTSRGDLTVKLVDLLPAYTMYGFDLFDPVKAKVYVWITPFREPAEKRPGFALTICDDPTWTAFFHRQFESLWNSEECSVCDLRSLLELDEPPTAQGSPKLEAPNTTPDEHQ